MKGKAKFSRYKDTLAEDIDIDSSMWVNVL